MHDHEYAANRMEHHLTPRDLGERRVLAAEGDVLYAARGFTLEHSLDGGLNFAPLAKVRAGAAERLMSSSSLTRRFFRTGFHGLLPLGGGAFAAIVRGRLLHLAAGATEFTTSHPVTRGTRPLNLCRSASGRVWFGEYWNNAERAEVHVYVSEDGRRFDVARSFPAGSIRHVHGIHADPHRGGMWVLTGDDGPEVGLWWTDDEFETLEPVLRGEQRARGVSILCTPEGLVLPTDTPQERNHVQFFDPRTGRLDALASLPGSCFAAASSRGMHYLSTAVEKSSVNTDARVALFASLDGFDWRPVARFERDLALLDDRRGYLQYPTLLLAAGDSRLPYLFATAQSIRGRHGRLLRWSESDVREVLSDPDALAA
ncbi:MAG: hypothetical protein H6831_04270 [Planctomycetes bacterium]|nr:hypothetical protein [Planctomycetota bacterium]MCB9903603.1 hypothetical protein [Planctomycetota bacterium]